MRWKRTSEGFRPVRDIRTRHTISIYALHDFTHVTRMYNIIKTTGEIQATIAPRKFDKTHDHEEVRRTEETEVDSRERERSKRDYSLSNRD